MDIVERLRDTLLYAMNVSYQEAVFHEAADEIERLRAELERLPAAMTQYKAALEKHCESGGRLFKETH